MPRRREPAHPVTSSGQGAVSAGRDITGPVTTNIGTANGTPLGLAARKLAKVFELVRVDDFVGRRWLLAELAEFMAKADRGYFVVEAEAGLGKSTFAAWLVAERRYPGHFTRLAGGNRARTALLNLSAQLIVEHELFADLEEHLHLPALDRSLVPEWAGEPDGFDSLLQVAAAKVARPDRPVVLVVDGLDEESPLSTPVPLGLPSGLPEHVYVVATCRTGTPVPDADTTVTPARIAADDPRNLGDMRDYVTQAAREPELAERLAAADVDVDEFATAVTERCGGVWIYAAHLLPDLRSGELAIGDLHRLPAKLSQYFAANLNSKRASPRWSTEDLPLLGALGAAFEPVRMATLSAWTGVDQAVVRQVCAQRYRAFLRLNARKVAVYHRSLNEFLSGETADQHPMLAATSDLIDEVSEQVAAAHDAIATFYLDQFTRDAAAFADLHDAYGRRFLTGHLRAADRHRDLRRLLSPGSGWPRDGIAYATDLETELTHVREHDVRPLNLSEGDEAFRFEVFGALYLAGMISGPGDVPVGLIDAFLTWQVWTVDAARELLDQVSNPARRAIGLLALARHVPAPDRESVVAAATGQVELIQNAVDAIRVQAQLLPRLPTEVPEELVARAQRIEEPGDAGRTLLALMAAGGGTESLFAVTVDLLRQEPDDETRAIGLAEAVRFAPPDAAEALVHEALRAVDAAVSAQPERLVGLPAEPKRAAVVAVLLGVVPAPLRPGLVAELRATPFGYGYEGIERALILARHEPSMRRELLIWTRAEAAQLRDPRLSAKALAQVHDFLAEHG